MLPNVLSKGCYFQETAFVCTLVWNHLSRKHVSENICVHVLQDIVWKVSISRQPNAPKLSSNCKCLKPWNNRRWFFLEYRTISNCYLYLITKRAYDSHPKSKFTKAAATHYFLRASEPRHICNMINPLDYESLPAVSGCSTTISSDVL